MKKITLLATSILMLCSSCVQSNNFVIKQNLGWLFEQVQEGLTIDSVVVVTPQKTLTYRQGDFTLENNILTVQGSIEKTCIATHYLYITVKERSTSIPTDFVLESGEMEIADGKNLYNVRGTTLNDDFYQFIERLTTSYREDKDNFEATLKNLFKEYTAKHTNDLSAVLYLTEDAVVNYLPSEVWMEGYNACSEEIRNNADVVKCKNKVEAATRSAEGQPFVDFTATYNGKEQKLSDYVGKGKYVLVDFWASWCGPCKMEIPNLINVYNKFKGEKFEVIGVATWDKPEDTLKAIEQLGIPYPQIMNAQREGSDAYNITGIPQIILFGPDGTILKRDLRGDDIEKTVAEYLK